MTIQIYPDLVQGSDEWFAARLGLLTASEIKLILTPTLKVADNDKTRQHLWELMAQRITQHVEPTYIGDEMLRGMEDEILARSAYSETYAEVTEAGFITNDCWGFTLGCSPDGLVGTDGGIEVKSRRQKYQIQTITEGVVPDDFVLQVQTCLLVTGRSWWDFISYSAGLPMVTIRMEPDEKIQAAIVEAAAGFEAKLAERMSAYAEASKLARLIPTERRVEQEMFV